MIGAGKDPNSHAARRELYLHARAAACNEVAGGGHQIASSKWRENWPRNGLRAPVANIRYSALNSPEVVCSSHSPDRPRMLVTRFVRPEPPLSERGPAAFHSAHGGKNGDWLIEVKTNALARRTYQFALLHPVALGLRITPSPGDMQEF